MDNELFSAMLLSCVEGLSLLDRVKIYEHFGSACVALEHIHDLEACGCNVSQQKQDKINSSFVKVRERVKQELEFIERKHVKAIALGDKRYPERLKQCEDRPLVIYYVGNADLNQQRIVSVVGTRHITDYGKDLCNSFIADLSLLFPDVIVVSGLAYGVDVCAHCAALKGNLKTIGVMGGGIDKIYPSSHREIAAKMARQGGIMTEYMSGSRIDKTNFLQRNRIVAGLADALVVIESAERGGSLTTARLANDYNRDVYAFPGRVSDEMSEGTNKLIMENKAHLIASAEDFAVHIGWMSKDKRKGKKDKKAIEARLNGLDEQALSVFRALQKRDEMTKTELVQELGIGIPIVIEALEMLGERDLVKELGANRFAIKR